MNVVGNLSHARGDSFPPLIEETIGAAFDRSVRAHGQREALVSCHQNARLTYSELARRIDELGAGFLQLGLQRGDRVGIWSPNCLEKKQEQHTTAKTKQKHVNIN